MAVENITTTAGLSEQLRTFYSMRLLKATTAYLPLLQDAQLVTIPKGSGKTIQWRKWVELALATTALTEGDPPTPQTLDLTEVTATLAQYGGYVKISRFGRDTWIDNVFQIAEKQLARQGGRSLHKLMADVVVAGTNVQYVNNAANRDALTTFDTLSVAEIEEAVSLLEQRNVERFPDGYYHGILHPKVAQDVKRDPDYRALYTGFQTGAETMQKNRMEPIAGVKFHVPSTDTPSFVSTTTVYATPIYGPDAFGAVDLAGNAGAKGIDPSTQLGMQVHVVPPETTSKLDPLGQYGTVGWIAAFVARRLDEDRLHRIESGATA